MGNIIKPGSAEILEGDIPGGSDTVGLTTDVAGSANNVLRQNGSISGKSLIAIPAMLIYDVRHELRKENEEPQVVEKRECISLEQLSSMKSIFRKFFAAPDFHISIDTESFIPTPIQDKTLCFYDESLQRSVSLYDIITNGGFEGDKKYLLGKNSD